MAYCKAIAYFVIVFSRKNREAIFYELTVKTIIQGVQF